MPRKKSLSLTEAELRLMDVVWDKGSATVQEVADAPPRELGLAHNTVLTTPGIPEDKNYPRYKKVKDGRAFGNRIEMLLQRGREFSPSVSFRRVAVGCFVLCCLVAAGSFAPRWIAFAKTPALQLTAPAPVMAPLIWKQSEPRLRLLAQAAASKPVPQVSVPEKAADPAFEVASIRPATFPDTGFAAGLYEVSATDASCRVDVSISGTLVSLPHASICELIAFAYGLKGYQVIGAPALPRVSGVREAMALPDAHPSFFYDIEARAPGPAAPTRDEVRAMLRTLLADRFQLKLHRDTRDLSYFALVIGKKGTKLIPAKDGCRPGHDPVHGDGPSRRFKSHVCNRSIEQLVREIGSRTDRPVIDKTGLTGNFDYDLQVEFSPGDSLNSVYLDAYREQLGLTLESRKGPVDVLVIDRVEPPSAN